MAEAKVSSSLERKILQEQVHLLYKGMVSSIIGTLLIAPVFCYVIWDHVTSRQNIILWLVVLFFILLFRTWDAIRYKNRLTSNNRACSWKQHFLLGSTASGIWWGLAAWLIYPTDSTHATLLILMIVGIVSFAVSTLSFRWESILIFTLSTLVPVVIRLLYAGDEYANMLALLLFIYFLFAINGARRIYRDTQQNIRLRIEAISRKGALSFAQQKQRLHMTQTPLAVIEWDIDFKLIEWNPAAEKTFGFMREAMLGQDVRTYIIPESAVAGVEKYWQEILQTKKSLEGVIFENLTQDGQRIICEWFVTPLVDQDNQVIGIIAQVQDVTAQKQAAAALIISKERAEKANNAKSEFLASMSHELRTPLNAILGFTQLLEYEEDLSTQHKNNISEISKAGSHLLELINEVLDLASIEAGHLKLSLEPVSLEQLLGECNTLVTPLAEQQGIQLNIDNKSCNKMVHADYTRLKQVLLNLLSNAVKYNRKEGSIWVNCSKGKEGFLKISVNDTGHGIEPHHLSELFESFNRLGAESSGIEGTGIGLVIARRLVEAMGGTIDADSVVGGGSIFWLQLPCIEHGTSISHQQRPKTQPITGNKAPYTILCVEDNLVNLRLMQQIIIRYSDASLLHALSAELGMEMALNQQPDLILMDINLPGMDGYAALKQLHKQPETSKIPVIAVTANAMKADIERLQSAGFDDYITKPIDVSQMMKTLDKVMEQP